MITVCSLVDYVLNAVYLLMRESISRDIPSPRVGLIVGMTIYPDQKKTRKLALRLRKATPCRMMLWGLQYPPM